MTPPAPCTCAVCEAARKGDAGTHRSRTLQHTLMWTFICAAVGQLGWLVYDLATQRQTWWINLVTTALMAALAANRWEVYSLAKINAEMVDVINRQRAIIEVASSTVAIMQSLHESSRREPPPPSQHNVN